jgi:hypothetical protein
VHAWVLMGTNDLLLQTLKPTSGEWPGCRTPIPGGPGGESVLVCLEKRVDRRKPSPADCRFHFQRAKEKPIWPFIARCSGWLSVLRHFATKCCAFC